LKLDFTYDANLASSMPAGEKSETGDSGVELPPPITMPPSAMMHRSTAVVSASVAELMPLQSPATDDLNLKIMSVKNVWEREHQGRTPLEQIFEQRYCHARVPFQRPLFLLNLHSTRSSADADNGLDAFSGQSRSTNMVPFWVHCDFSLSI